MYIRTEEVLGLSPVGHLQVQLSNQICYRGVPQPVYVQPNSFRTNEVKCL